MTDKLKAAIALGMFIASEDQFTEEAQQQAIELASDDKHPLANIFNAIEFAVHCVPHASELPNKKLFGMVNALKESFSDVTGGNAARREFMKQWLISAEQPQTEQQIIPEVIPNMPPHFELGRYEGISNNDYHASNGISSSQVKDARISLMYYQGRHVTRTIQKESTEALTFGTLVHALVLEPETIDAEFSIQPIIPEGAFTGTESMTKWLKEYNASLPPLLSSDEIKGLLEEHNGTLPSPYSLGGGVDDVGNIYTSLPEQFQTIPKEAKYTATAMKACIKEYNATLPQPFKTSGSRDALLEQLAVIKPELVAEDRAKPVPLNTSGTKDEISERIKALNPNAIFADEIFAKWNADNSKIRVTRQQLELGTAIQQAVFNHPEAGQIVNHETRAVEVSYYGMDEDTGLETRVRPDLEITYGGVRVGFDLKTVSLGRIKQEALRAKLHRTIIDMDYHVSASMYCDTADLDQFFWIFVNKDEGYHWIAIVEASPEELELGQLEYKKTLKDIRQAMDTGIWPAPFTSALVDELNDFDLRRLDALRTNA